MKWSIHKETQQRWVPQRIAPYPWPNNGTSALCRACFVNAFDWNYFIHSPNSVIEFFISLRTSHYFVKEKSTSTLVVIACFTIYELTPMMKDWRVSKSVLSNNISKARIYTEWWATISLNTIFCRKDCFVDVLLYKKHDEGLKAAILFSILTIKCLSPPT